MAQKTGKKGDKTFRFPHLGVGMKTSLIVSLLLHVLLLSVIQASFPVNNITRQLRSYPVEFLLPLMNEVEDEEVAETESANGEQTNTTAFDQTEDTISLDTEDKQYSSYAKMIKAKLMRYWNYPLEARKNLLEGDVLVLFTLNPLGALENIMTLLPSGSNILDKEATRAIRAAAPFPPFPSTVTVARLNIRANFSYRLTAGQRQHQASTKN